jgi:hypothetical protein
MTTRARVDGHGPGDRVLVDVAPVFRRVLPERLATSRANLRVLGSSLAGLATVARSQVRRATVGLPTVARSQVRRAISLARQPYPKLTTSVEAAHLRAARYGGHPSREFPERRMAERVGFGPRGIAPINNLQQF